MFLTSHCCWPPPVGREIPSLGITAGQAPGGPGAANRLQPAGQPCVACFQVARKLRMVCTFPKFEKNQEGYYSVTRGNIRHSDFCSVKKVLLEPGLLCWFTYGLWLLSSRWDRVGSP